MPGLDPKRRDIALAGGALLAELLKAAGADEILTGERGLREGILLDSRARSRGGSVAPISRDLREKSVERLAGRWNVEWMHARCVAKLSDEIFQSTHALHQMTEREREWLRFAAILHDAGASVGMPRHHKHSYYLITHGDLTGFSSEEIATIAAVARYHRGGRPKERHPEWESLDPWRRQSVEKLAAILRVADGLDRGHRQIVESVACRLRQKKVIFEVTAHRGSRSRDRGGDGQVETVCSHIRPQARFSGERARGAAPPSRRRGEKMKEHFAEQLEHLRRRLILFGAEVEKQIAAAVEALTEGSAIKARAVIAADELIDRTEVEIEEEAIQLFALQQPVAVDLRLLIGALKINNDLERIGDHAVNIAEGAERISGMKPVKPFVDLPHMAEIAMSMLKNALDSFVNRDTALAQRRHPQGRRARRKEPVDHPRAADLHGGDALADFLLPGADLGLEEPGTRRRPRDEHRGGHDLHCAGESREAPRGRDRLKDQIAGKGCARRRRFSNVTNSRTPQAFASAAVVA